MPLSPPVTTAILSFSRPWPLYDSSPWSGRGSIRCSVPGGSCSWGGNGGVGPFCFGSAMRSNLSTALVARRQPAGLPGLPDLGATDELDAGGAHLLQRATYVSRLQLDAARGVLDDEGPEPELARVQRAELHAVVGGEAGDVQLGRAPSLQVVAQAGGLAVSVVEERAVAVDARIGAFAEDGLHPLHLEAGSERGARRALHAVVG